MLSNRCIFPADMLQLIALGNTWPHGQAVKTLPSHGKNWGSIPHGATIKKYVDEVGVFFYACPSGKRRGMPFCAAVRQFVADKFLRRAPACGKPQFPMLVPNTQYVDEAGVFFYACPSGKRRGMPFCAAVRQFAAGKFLRRAPACGKPQFPYAYTKYTHNTSTKSAKFFMPAPQGNAAACPFMPRFVNLPQANFCGGLPLAGNRNFPMPIQNTHTTRRRSRRIFLCLPLRGTARHVLLCRGSSICRKQIFNSSPDYRRYTVRIIMPVISGFRRFVLTVIITGCLF